MSDVTSRRTAYPALLVPDAVATDGAGLWAAESSYTEQGPRVAVPVMDSTSSLLALSAGEQGTPTAIDVRVMAPGLPGQSSQSLALGWRPDGATRWRGWDDPTILNGYAVISLATSSPVGEEDIEAPHGVALTDGTVVLAYQATHHAVGPVTTYRLQIRTRSTAGAWSSAVTVLSQSNAPTQGYHPCLVVMQVGAVERVVLLAWVEEAERAHLRAWYSDDSGATWAVLSRYAIPGGIDISGSPGSAADGYDVGRLRAVEHLGAWCLVAEVLPHDTDLGTGLTTQNVLGQWASIDGCATWTQVDLGGGDGFSAGADWLVRPELAVVAGRLLLLGIGGERTAPVIYAQTLPTVWSAWSMTGAVVVGTTAAEVATVTTRGAGYVVSAADMAAAVLDTGLLVTYATSASGKAMQARGTVDGRTWIAMVERGGIATSASPIYTHDSSSYPTGYCAVAQTGGVLLVGGFAASPGTLDDSLVAHHLGGWTTATMPVDDYPTSSVAGLLGARGRHNRHWLPYDLPSDMGWTATGAGTASVATGLLVLTTSASAIYYDDTLTGMQGVLVRAVVKVSSGGSLASDDVAIRVRVADGTDDYDISVRLTTTGYRVVDNNNGGATLGSDQSRDFTATSHLLIWLGDGTVRVWSGAQADALDLTLGVDAAATDDTATPNAAGLLAWGHRISGTATSTWSILAVSEPDYVGRGLSATAYPDDLWGQPASGLPQYLGTGITVAAAAGPGIYAETAAAGLTADYPLARIWPASQPSPRIGWRSVADGVQETIALDVAGGANNATHPDWLGLYLGGINWRTGTLQGYNQGSGWVDLLDIDAATGHTGLRIEKGGRRARAYTGSSTDAPVVPESSQIGATLEIGGSPVAKVTGNTGGVWRTAGPLPVLELDTDVGSGTATTGALWQPQMVAVVELGGSNYRGFRLVIDAQTTADGDYRIGTMVLGAVRPFADPYGWGRVVEADNALRVSTSRDGVRRASADAPRARRVILAWADGVEQTGYSGAEPTPDTIAPSVAGQPVGSVGDVAWLLDGLARRTGGAAGQRQVPVVYLPAVQVGADQVITRRDLAVLASWDGRVRSEVVQGDEDVDELVRIDAVVLEELV